MNRRNCPFVPVVIGCYAIFFLLLASPQGYAQASQQQQVTQFVQDLKSPNPSVLRSAVDGLAKIGLPAVPALMEALKNTDADVHANAEDALVKIGLPAVPALIQALKRNADEEVPRRAADALGDMGAPAAAAVPALSQTLHDRDVNVRSAAAQALRKIKEH
jgi:HEAT repeat protein